MVALTKLLGANGAEPATIAEQKQIEIAVRKRVEFLDLPRWRLSTLLQLLPAAPSGGMLLTLPRISQSPTLSDST